MVVKKKKKNKIERNLLLLFIFERFCYKVAMVINLVTKTSEHKSTKNVQVLKNVNVESNFRTKDSSLVLLKPFVTTT